MPIYEYRCQACHHEFETMQKMSDPELIDCPDLASVLSAADVTPAIVR